MKLHLAPGLLIAACLVACEAPEWGRPLPEGWPALIKLEAGERRPDFTAAWADRHEVLLALQHSLEWHERPSSQQFFPIENITHARSKASLEHFKHVLETSDTPEEFDATLAVEFDIYRAAGWDGEGGGVLFTGYCTPILHGNLASDGEYRYQLYRLPGDLAKGKDGAILGQKQPDGSLQPYPTREAIEAGHLLEGQQLELVYLRDPLDAFIAHVNGSAVIELPDGTQKRYGYAGKNGREYRSLGRMLVEDGVLAAEDVSLTKLRTWGAENPEQLVEYIRKDDSFVFFLEIDGPPKGSLNVDVSPGRTLATDKTLFPRGAIVFVDVDVPKKKTRVRTWWESLTDTETEEYSTVVYDRFMFDQDTGGAIRTAGRADIYMGIGDEAEWTAGQMRSPGQLYYLFLKERTYSLRP